MLGPKLLAIAEHVGLAPVEIARHLGVARSLVSHWNSGYRLVSDTYREALMALVLARTRQRSEEMKRPGVPLVERRRFFRRLLPLIMAFRTEGLLDRHQGPLPSVREVLAQLEACTTAPDTDLDDPATAKQLITLSKELLVLSTMKWQFAPFEQFMQAHAEDAEDAENEMDDQDPGDTTLRGEHAVGST